MKIRNNIDICITEKIVHWDNCINTLINIMKNR